MPVDLLLDNERRVMRTHASGFVTLADFIDSMEKILQLKDQGNIDDSWTQIVDLTDVSNEHELSESDTRIIATNNSWPAGARRAIVVTEENTSKLANIYQKVGQEMGQQIKLFKTIEEAEKWLEGALET